MATLTGSNLLASIIDSTGIEPNALIQATLTAKLQQLIDNGTYSKLAASIATSAFSTEINAATEVADLGDTIEANVALIEAAADQDAVDAIDFPDYGGPAPITFTLTAGADSTYEGEANTFTVTASAPVEEDTTVTFQLVEGTAGLDDFNAGSFNPLTATILAGETTASVSYEAITNDGTELAETYSVTATIDGVSVGSVDATILDGSVGAGQTFTLTTGLDIIPGMTGSNGNTVNSGNDTIIGVINTTNLSTDSTYTAVDMINAGDGTDTLKVTVVGNLAATIPTSAENVEMLSVASSISDQTKELTLNTTSMTGLEDVNVTKLGGDLNLDTAATTDVDLTAAAVAGAAMDIDGGNNINVALTKADTAGDLLAIGTDTDGGGADLGVAPKGTVDVSATHSDIVGGTGAMTMNAITTTGGTVVNIIQDANSVSGDVATAAGAADVITQGAVTVTGTTATTSVNVTNSDQVTANAAVPAVAGANQTQIVTFSEMSKGQSVTVNGLTFTAAKALTAEEVAQAFANLTKTDYQDDGGPTANGTYSGQNFTLSYTTGDANGAAVTYTAATKAGNTVALTVSNNGGTNTAPTVAAGVNGQAATLGETGRAGVANGAVTINDGGTASITTIEVDGYSAGATLGAGGSLDALTDLSLGNSSAGAAALTSTSTSLNLTLDDVDGTVTLPGTVATLTVDTEGTASKGSIVAAGATSVVINADAKYTAGGLTNLLGATSVDVNGTAAVSLANNGFANNTTLQTIDASDNSGGMTVTLDTGNRVAYTGSTGTDMVTLAQTTIAAGDNVALGTGDDTLTFTGAIVAGNIAAGVTLSGGDGTDTIGFTSAQAATVTGDAGFEAFVDGFEKLAIGQTAGGATDSVNLANMDDISYVVSANSAAGAAAQTETGTYTFPALNDGQALTLAGVTVRAVGGNLTDAQVAEAFDSANNGGTPAAVSANSVVTGTYSGWNAADNGGLATIVYTSSTANTNVADLDTTDSTAGLVAVVDVAAGNAIEGDGAGAKEAFDTVMGALTTGQSYTYLGIKIQALTNLADTAVGAAFTAAAGGGGSTATYLVSGSLTNPTNWGVPVVTNVGATVTATNATDADIVSTASEFTADGNDAVTAPATGTQSAYTPGAAAAAAGGLTITHMADDGTLELNAAGAGASVTMTDSSGTADSFNIVLDDSLTAAGFNAGTVAVSNDAAATSKSGVETLNISVDDTFMDVTGAFDEFGAATGDGKDDTNAAFTLTVTDAAGTTNSFETVNVSGAGDLNLTTATSVATSNLTTVNASSLEGVLTYTASIANLTVTGGSGADMLTILATADGADINGGAGKDNFAIAAGVDLLTIDGGADADTFDFNGVSTNKSNFVVIEGIGSGDTLDFDGLVDGAPSTKFTSTQITLSQGATESTQAYLDQAMTNLDENGFGWFQYNGNTYIAGDVGTADSANSFADGGDFVVMLTGLVDLSTASFNTTVATLEIA